MIEMIVFEGVECSYQFWPDCCSAADLHVSRELSVRTAAQSDTEAGE